VRRRWPLVGFLSSVSPTAFSTLLGAFQKGLSEASYVRNVASISMSGGPVRSTAGARGRSCAPSRAGDQHASDLRCKSATTTIPIVFGTGSDPVRAGLVASLNRPDGNITGINILTETLESKAARTVAPDWCRLYRVPLIRTGASIGPIRWT
jgi:ABC transporter substrate binding protein